MQKHKFASISLTVRDRAISSKFLTQIVSEQATLYNFQTKFPLFKHGGLFEFLPKMQNHKFASISITMRDRAISSKFSTQRVSEQTTLCNFKKMVLSSKMAAILNFRIFTKNAKHKFASISLTVRDRAISSKFSTHGVSQQSTLANF